eukprot:gnl/TRDRNA2_/TRDRNA2_154459_c0_seq3.p1 gnl/TRDRNA2_/TRDRNA2_154459_c0~~gnl/TRDRNA2_/TRDRNA2_154459_c0_seq3.p1  ORF type:complete len:175 (-),score=43.62 gnl/TRDRNA2_/TRDRNA2_154459_c0_seq3:128-652(-)
MASLMRFGCLFLFGMPTAAVEDEIFLIQTKLSVVVAHRIGNGSGRALPERPVSARYDTLPGMEDSEIRTANDEGALSHIKNELADEDAIMKSPDMNELKSYILSQGMSHDAELEATKELELEATQQVEDGLKKAKLDEEERIEMAKQHERLEREAEEAAQQAYEAAEIKVANQV